MLAGRIGNKGNREDRNIKKHPPPPSNSIDELEEVRSPVPTLVKTYGEFWNPDFVSLTGKRLMGRLGTSNKNQSINVYDERGVYVLYKDYEPVYVGRADRETIGARIQKHRRSQSKGPRWDRFSWFGIRGLTGTTRKVRAIKSSYPATKEVLIATLEALLIVTIEPRLNRRKEKFKDAVRLYQAENDRPADIEEHLGSIERKLDELLSTRRTK